MTYNGLSSIPRLQATGHSPWDSENPSFPTLSPGIDEVILRMNEEQRLPIWRMSYAPSDPPGTDYRYIQYYLDHCPYDLIVDYFHMYTMTEQMWLDSRDQALAICAHFQDYPRFQSRVWLEPQNESLTADLDTKTNEFVAAIRNQGYSNNIVSNVFWRTPIENMANVHDSLNRFWTGHHIYFYSAGSTQNWTLASAKAKMQLGLNAGLKMVNTEIGADTDGQVFFDDKDGVQLVNEFMAWCSPLNIGNNVWTMYGDYDYPVYKSLGLTFPATIGMPFHDNFVDLSKWLPVAGTWSVK